MLRALHRCRPLAHPATLMKVVGLSFCLLLSMPSGAADAPSLRGFLVAEQTLSLQQAVELVRKRFKGQVVKATQTEFQGRAAYRIRLVDAGRVREVLVDAQSGEIINP